MLDSFAFVPNFLDYCGPLPLEIAPGVLFDRSNAAQARGITKFLESHGHAFSGGPWLYFVEPLKEPPASGFSYERLPPERLRFWVLNYSGDPTRIWKLCEVAQLTDSELEVSATFYPNRTDAHMQSSIPQMFHFSQSNIHPILRKATVDDLQLIGPLQAKVYEFATTPEDASRATVLRTFKSFAELSNFTRYGHLALLGHFALLESLITHDPHQFGDSLNHQLSTKLPLLMRRFRRPLEVPKSFALADPRTLRKRLYEVRSTLAHGGHVDFTKGRLRDLGDGSAVFGFVRTALKRLIIQASEEPELVHDLQAC